MILFLAILIFSINLFSQICPELKYSRDFYKIYSIEVDQNFLYLSEGENLNKLSIYEISNPAQPIFYSSIDLSDSILDILVKDNYAYCAVYKKGLQIVDIRDKKNPKIKSKLSFSGNGYANGLAILDDYLYLCGRYWGLIIIDIKEKSNPKEVNRINSVEALKAKIRNNYLFISAVNGIFIYSLEDKLNPKFVSKAYEKNSGDLVVSNNFIYATGWAIPLIIIDISNIKNPILISKFDGVEISPPYWDVIEEKNDIVFSGGIGRFMIIDVFDKENPFLVGQGDFVFSMKIKDNLIYTSYKNDRSPYTYSLRIYDISNCKHENSYPQASFEYEPLNPRAGEKVYFKDTSYPYAKSFLWDFGDGQKSVVKNPENVFLKEGEVEVKFTAKNPAGETTVSKKIYVSKGQDAPPFEGSGEYKYLIPAVAHTKGANGTFWQSDIEIVNGSYEDDANINIYFIEQGEGNCNYQGFNVLVKSSQQVRLKDIVYKMFQEEKAGALWITSDIPVFISSRTYNTGGGEGTYGQYVPAIEREKIYKNNKKVVLPNVVWNEEFRTNIGFVNIEDKEKSFCFNYETGEGPLCMTMPACSWNQLSLSDLIDVNYGWGYFEWFLWTMGYTDGLFLYSSVIDNKTGDAIFIPEIVKP